MSLFTEYGIDISRINKNNASYDRILPAMLILDISESTKKYSQKMITSTLALVKKLKKNEAHKKNVMLSIIVFNSKHETILEFQRLGDIDETLLENKLKELPFKGRTHTGSAVIAAFGELNKMKEEKRREGRRFYLPIIFLCTDGNPQYTSKSNIQEEEKHLQDSYETILNLQKNKKGFFYAISIGNNVDKDIMQKLAGNGTPLSIDQEDVSRLFEAVTDTIDSGADNIDTMDEDTLNEKYEAFRKRASDYEEDE